MAIIKTVEEETPQWGKKSRIYTGWYSYRHRYRQGISI